MSASKHLAKRNLAFFRLKYPEIYAELGRIREQKYQLYTNKDTGPLDLRLEGKSIYQYDMLRYTQKEVDVFLTTYPESGSFRTTLPTQDDAYPGERLFCSSINSSLKKSPLFNQPKDKSYLIPSTLPLCVVLGVGFHLDILISKRSVQQLIVVEPDVERLYCSLFFLDWEELHADFSDTGCSLALICSIKNTEAPNDDAFYGRVWNVLTPLTPLFPLCAFFYNHLACPRNAKIVDSLKKDVLVNFQSWGQFDDELNQLNNALHNLYESKYLILKPRSQLDDLSDVTVCIVGSGPSLDQRIEDLKEMQQYSLIFSCGTALHALHKHGLTPDFHIEIESHTVSWSSSIKPLLDEDPAYLQNIALIAATQVHPRVCAAFGSVTLFFKDSSALSAAFAQNDQVVDHATPTCTNAAVAVANYLKVGELVFFGCDYGFYSPDHHHAKGTIYGDENATEHIKRYVKETENKEIADHVCIKGIGGRDLLTTPIYFASLRRLENALVVFARHTNRKILNCSEGADIRSSNYCSSEDLFLDLRQRKKAFNIEKIGFTEKKAIIDEGLLRFEHYILERVGMLKSELSDLIGEEKGILQLVLSVTPNILALVDAEDSFDASFHYFLRGSVWHWLYLGLSHGLLLDASEQDMFLRSWLKDFISFLDQVPGTVLERTSRCFPNDQDDWLDKHVEDAVERFA